jgi:hypothetical protein
LDIPVSGSLDDPNFRVFPVMFKVVDNLLKKAAESPFTLLGKALGGGAGQELSSVDFAPGEAALAPSENAKLKKLAKALYERPLLTLRIAGSCAPAADGAVLARRRLQRQINKLRAEEEAAAGQTVESVESIKLSPSDYARLLQKLYEKTFGPISTNQSAASPSNAPPAAAPPPPKAPELVFVPASPQPGWTDSSTIVRGGELMMRHDNARRPPPNAAAPKLAAPTGPPPVETRVTPSAPSAPSAADRARMEQRLLAEIKVTDDELRELMQARARTVQAALLGSGQISAERIFILSTKAINNAAQGETRANFSLE